MSLRRAASAGFFALAVATAGWWAGLARSEGFRRLFLGPAGEFARDLAPFALADLGVLVPVALASSWAIARGRTWARAAAWAAAGAALYATFATASLWRSDRLAALGLLLMTGAATGAVIASWSLDWDPARPFRVAEGGTRADHLARTALETVVLWSLFLGLFPYLIAATERELGWAIPFERQTATALTAIGWTLFAAASALGLWSGWTMATRGDGTPLPRDTAKNLVVAGPYRFVRNPMTVAGLAQATAVGIARASWLVPLYALAGALIWNHFARPAEERDLEQRFGPPYTRYRDQVRCWLPRPTPFRGDRGAGQDQGQDQDQNQDGKTFS